jgi:hypothetical protein
MQPLKAVVRNGRLVVDEPTELPEGTELVLAVVEDEGEAEELAAVARALRDRPRRGEITPERQAVIAERIARVRAGQAETLTLEEVERSIRDDLDL